VSRQSPRFRLYRAQLNERSRRKVSNLLLVSFGTRLLAIEANATHRPFALISGVQLPSFPWTPALLTLTRVVVLPTRSRTKMSNAWFVSPETRLLPRDMNVTYRPLLLIAPSQESLLPFD
jgi:hypothetical protein